MMMNDEQKTERKKENLKTTEETRKETGGAAGKPFLSIQFFCSLSFSLSLSLPDVISRYMREYDIRRRERKKEQDDEGRKTEVTLFVGTKSTGRQKEIKRNISEKDVQSNILNHSYCTSFGERSSAIKAFMKRKDVLRAIIVVIIFVKKKRKFCFL